MLEPSASAAEIVPRAMVSVRSLLRVAEILALIIEYSDRALRDASRVASSKHDTARSSKNQSASATSDGDKQNQKGRHLGDGDNTSATGRRAKTRKDGGASQ